MIELAVYAVIAVFIFSRLYSSLGKISTSDLFRDVKATSSVNEDPDNVVDSHGLEIALADAQLISTMSEEIANKASSVLEQSKLIDPTFSLTEFLDGAVVAFEMIIKKFQSADVKGLSLLISEDLIEKLKSDIAARSAELTYHTEFVKIDRPSILDISINSSSVFVELSISSQQINFAKNAEGTVVIGSVSKIEKMSDVWCFVGDLQVQRGRWRLVSTQKMS